MADLSRFPLVEEISTSLTAPEAFELIRDAPHSFFLDSGMDPLKLGRFSFMGYSPFLVMRSRDSEITLVQGSEEEEVQQGNPFDVLGGLLEKYKLDYCLAPLPFLGGVVGYLGYDLCHFIERLPSIAQDDLNLPQSYLAFYDAVLAFDHLEGRVYLVSTGFPELEEARRLRRARMRLEEMKERVCSSHPVTATAPRNVRENKGITLESNFTPEEYIEAVSRVREYIASGDVFQVNLSQRFEAELEIPPWELYRRLREVNPAPFASYLNFEGVTIVSASPERFLKVRQGLVETRPVKGTRPRGQSPEEDAALAQELLHSAKDRAENVMIVNLERNDLGRVCRYGTVKVTELAILETFPTVFHLTSTVIGHLSENKSNIDLLKATFPGGSITGAPKVRAMELIDELEPTQRSVYTGSIGYLGFNGDLDINIVIRTLLVKGGRVYFQVGGGVVYDSDPEEEYQETLDKAKALIQALKLASRVVVTAK